MTDTVLLLPHWELVTWFVEIDRFWRVSFFVIISSSLPVISPCKSGLVNLWVNAVLMSLLHLWLQIYNVNNCVHWLDPKESHNGVLFYGNAYMFVYCVHLSSGSFPPFFILVIYFFLVRFWHGWLVPIVDSLIPPTFSHFSCFLFFRYWTRIDQYTYSLYGKWVFFSFFLT